MLPLLVLRLQDALHRGDLPSAQELLDELRADPLAEHPYVQASIFVLEGDYFRQIRRPEDARAALRRAEQATDDESIRAQVLALHGAIDLQEGDYVAAREVLTDALALAERLGDRSLAGDAAFNLATIASVEQRDDEHEALIQRAEAHYESRGRIGKIIDCKHALGAHYRARGGRDSEAIRLLNAALSMAMKRDDPKAVARVAGDLARTHYCRAMEGIEGELDIAKAINAYVEVADDRCWQRVEGFDDSFAVRLEHAEESFNNLETGLLIALEAGDHYKAGAIICGAKGRLLRSRRRDREAAFVARYRGRVSEQRKHEDIIASAALPEALVDVGYRMSKVALVEHFALGAGDAFVIGIVALETVESRLGLVQWDAAQVQPERVRDLRGRGQGIEAREAAGRVLSGMQTAADRAAYYVGDDLRPAPEAIESAGELSDDLTRLGEWFFPASVRDLLRSSGVRHVFLSPDPRLFSLPWLALRFRDGTQVVDQPWTLSLLPSGFSLYSLIRRREGPTRQVLSAFFPLREVNENHGGEQEARRLGEMFPNVQLLIEDEATLGELGVQLGQGRWVHIRTHGAGLADGRYVPRLADGVWSEVTGTSNGHGVLICAACRTGSTVSVGQEIFGLIELADVQDLRALVAPVIAVDSSMAAIWMNELYSNLHDGLPLGEAVRNAARKLRDLLAHPAYWASFVCVGDPDPMLRP